MANTTNRIIWWALIGALIIYAVVAVAVAPSLGLADERDPRQLAIALGVVSLSMALASIFIRGRMLVRPIQSGALDPRRPEDLQRAFVSYLICILLTESIGIFGLVVALLSGRPEWAMPFLGLALALMLVHRPTAADLQPPAGSGHAHLDPTPIV